MPYTSGLPLTEAERDRDAKRRAPDLMAAKRRRRDRHYERPPPPGLRKLVLRMTGEKDDDEP